MNTLIICISVVAIVLSIINMVLLYNRMKEGRR